MPADSPDLPAIAELLQRYNVDCVLVGGMSAVLHGSTVTTKDIDTVPLWTRSNLDRLCTALNSVDAQIMVRSSPDGDQDHDEYRRLPGGIDYDDIRHIGNFRIRTASGDRLDVLQSIPLEPGEDGRRVRYADLDATASTAMITDDISLKVMSRDHLIASKTAIGRPHDIAVVRELRQLREANQGTDRETGAAKARQGNASAPVLPRSGMGPAQGSEDDGPPPPRPAPGVEL